MAVPEEVRPQLDLIEGAVRGVIEAVNDARLDRRTDEPGSGLSVAEALGAVERASNHWFVVSDDLEAALDAVLARRPDDESEVRACQSALMLLHAAVGNEIALVQPLESAAGELKLADIPARPTAGGAGLAEAAFGRGALLALLAVGTDDDAAPEPPGTVSSNQEVGQAVRTIRSRSADAITDIVAGTAAPPLVGVLPLPAGVPAAMQQLLEQFGEWGVEQAIDHLPGRVSRLVRLALNRVKRLLGKILGDYRDDVVAASVRLLSDGSGDETARRDFMNEALSRLFDTRDVMDRGTAAIDRADRLALRARVRRLRKLQDSNGRWIGPVEILSLGLGSLWAVPIVMGPVVMPAAPAAAAALLAWVVLVSGDQLDTKRRVPNFWKGVVQRSEGH
jgi:hypothetical protein